MGVEGGGTEREKGGEGENFGFFGFFFPTTSSSPLGTSIHPPQWLLPLVTSLIQNKSHKGALFSSL